MLSDRMGQWHHIIHEVKRSCHSNTKDYPVYKEQNIIGIPANEEYIFLTYPKLTDKSA